MLDAIDPRELDELMAADFLDPEPGSRLAEILKLGFAAMCSTRESQVDPEQFEPKRKLVKHGGAERSDDAAEGVASPNQAAALAAMSLGPPTGRRN